MIIIAAIKHSSYNPRKGFKPFLDILQIKITTIPVTKKEFTTQHATKMEATENEVVDLDGLKLVDRIIK